MEDYKEYDDVAGNVPVSSDFTPLPSNPDVNWRLKSAVTTHNHRLADHIAALPENLRQERATVLSRQSNWSAQPRYAGGK